MPVANRRLALVAMGAVGLAGLLVVAAAVASLVGYRPATRDFGPAAAAISRDPAAGNSGRLTGSRSPRLAGPPLLPSPPTQVRIPALGIAATVESVAAVDGQLTVPDDPTTVGWWAGGAQPGSPSGTVVLDGHVDSATRGLGAFFRLTTLRAGDIVVVTTLRGDRMTYRVAARRSYPKATGLPPDLFTTTGLPRLALITCGGQFDHTALSYVDNVVVFATPTNMQTA